MLIGGEFPRSSQFKKFLNVVLHRNAVGKNHWWKIGSFAPPGGGNALIVSAVKGNIPLEISVSSSNLLIFLLIASLCGFF